MISGDESTAKRKNAQDDMFALIRAFSGKESILPVPVVYVRYMGNWEDGAFLSQLIYWSDKGKDIDGWFYKTVDEWCSELCVSEYSVRRAIRNCVKKGFLETRVKKVNGSPTLHFHLDKDKFVDLFSVALKNGFCENEVSKLRRTQFPNFEEHSFQTSKNEVSSFTSLTTSLTTSPTAEEKASDAVASEQRSASQVPEKQKKVRPSQRTAPAQTVKEPTPHDLMFGALEAVTGLDSRIKSNAGQLARAAKELREGGYAAADIAGIYGAEGAWWTHDWRGQRHETPSLKAIAETIGKLRSAKNLPPPRPAGKETPNERDRRLFENAKRDLGIMDTEDYGQPVAEYPNGRIIDHRSRAATGPAGTAT